jgi:polyisoprenoid-binding protein YceI
MKKWIVGIVIAVVVLGGAGFAFWYTQIRVETDEKATIKETPVDTATADATADGTYTVQTGADTFLGYRAEEVVFGQNQTPTGRTPGVTGSLTVSGTEISDVEITADLTGLSTGEDRRDQRAQSALGTSENPDATFTLTEPITLAAEPVAGEKVTVDATGDLTINGTTKSVTFPLEALWNGTTIQVAATPDLKFSDFGVDVGSFEPFATVQDAGQLDIQLTFVKS